LIEYFATNCHIEVAWNVANTDAWACTLAKVGRLFQLLFVLLAGAVVHPGLQQQYLVVIDFVTVTAAAIVNRENARN
jgi:hypothetical protein